MVRGPWVLQTKPQPLRLFVGLGWKPCFQLDGTDQKPSAERQLPPPCGRGRGVGTLVFFWFAPITWLDPPFFCRAYHVVFVLLKSSLPLFCTLPECLRALQSCLLDHASMLMLKVVIPFALRHAESFGSDNLRARQRERERERERERAREKPLLVGLSFWGTLFSGWF